MTIGEYPVLSRELTYIDSVCEIRLSGDVAVIFDRDRDKYLRTTRAALPDTVVGSMRPIRSSVSTAAMSSLVALTLALFAFNLVVLGAHHARPTSFGWIVVAIYLVMSIALHEIAHVASLRMFSRRVDKVGFKLNYWVFPAFFVRMNQSVLLARMEQAFIHIAGLLANFLVGTVLMVTNLLWLHHSDITFALQVTLVALAWNLVPILNSDGYRVLLALTGGLAVRGLRANTWWVILIKFSSFALAAVAFVHFIGTILRGVHG